MRKERLDLEPYRYGLPSEGPLWQIAGSRFYGSGNARTVIGGLTLEDLAALRNDISALLAKHSRGEIFGTVGGTVAQEPAETPANPARRLRRSAR